MKRQSMLAEGSSPRHYLYDVGFVRLDNGKRDSTWVKARSKKDAIAQAVNKLNRCYGIEAKDFVVYD